MSRYLLRWLYPAPDGGGPYQERSFYYNKHLNWWTPSKISIKKGLESMAAARISWSPLRFRLSPCFERTLCRRLFPWLSLCDPLHSTGCLLLVFGLESNTQRFSDQVRDRPVPVLCTPTPWSFSSLDTQAISLICHAQLKQSHDCDVTRYAFGFHEYLCKFWQNFHREPLLIYKVLLSIFKFVLNPELERLPNFGVDYILVIISTHRDCKARA